MIHVIFFGSQLALTFAPSRWQLSHSAHPLYYELLAPQITDLKVPPKDIPSDKIRAFLLWSGIIYLFHSELACKSASLSPSLAAASDYLSLWSCSVATPVPFTRTASLSDTNKQADFHGRELPFRNF